jgi:plastocyanin
MPSFRLRISGFLAILTIGCGGGGSSGPQPTNSMASTGGVGQSDTVLSTLPTPLAVLVKDQSNTPVQGVNVTWTAPTGGKVNGATSVVTPTDASGAASVTLILGTTAGTQSVTAAASGVTGSPVNFSETATPGHPFSLAFSSQSATTGPPNGTLTYSVVAKDQHGNGVSSVSITWAATVGGGLVTPPTNTTGGNGIASTQHQLGPADGQDTVSATSTPALQGSPVKIGALIATAPLVDTITVGPGIVFSPGSVALKAGGVVTFKWAGGPHGIHFTSGPAPLPANSATMSSGTVDYTLNNAGTYSYNCVVHGSLMTGSITVQP